MTAAPAPRAAPPEPGRANTLAFNVDPVSHHRLDAARTLAHLQVRLAPAAIADWFAHRVAREPRDLRHHVQRLNHHLEQGEALGSYAALADLWLVLGDKGRALRQHMLERSSPLLPVALRGWFAERLDTGLAPNAALPEACPAVLWTGATGSVAILAAAPGSAATPDAEAAADALDMADALIQQGELATARSLLERALVHTPDDIALRRALDAVVAHLPRAAAGSAPPSPPTEVSAP